MAVEPRALATLACLALTFSPCAAQPVQRGARYEVADGFPGVSIFSPRRWGIVGVTIVNPTERSADLLSAHYFSGNPDLQFARRLWVPSQARRSSWYPVLPPKDPVRSAKHLAVHALLVDRSATQEVLLKDPGGAMIYDGLLPSETGQDPVTGLIADPEDQQAGMPAIVARLALQKSPRLVRLDGAFLPATAEGLQRLDQLIVASDRPAGDPAGLTAIRRWLHDGGRLWVMLDRVSPATVSLLLGEEFPGTVLDRVELTRWQFLRERTGITLDDETLDRAPGPRAQAGTERFNGQIDIFEQPVEMVRVVVPDVKPTHSINGWPASFWRRSGRGTVLFTTVTPRGWVRSRVKPQAFRLETQHPFPHFEASEPLQQLAGYFWSPSRNAQQKPLDFAAFVSEQVGYGIVKRGTVLAVLGTFCLSLLTLTVWLGRRGQLGHLGWLGPCAALAAALLLLVLGKLSLQAIPATVAEAQWVEVLPRATDAAVTGLLAFYNQEAWTGPLGAEQGGIFLPDLKGEAGAARRMVWTDLDCWHWENLSLAAGLHVARFATSARWDRPPSARATFGPEGVVGKVAPGPFHDLGDAVLALPGRGNFAVRFAGPDGAFVAGTADQLEEEQFLSAAVPSAEQRRRQAIYRQLFDRSILPRYPAQPMFLTWASPLDLGFTFAEGVQRAGSALVAIPLEMERAAPGTEVNVPGPFVTYRSVELNGLGASLYDSRRNEWVRSMKAPAKTMLRFQVPPELMPLRVERAVLTVDLNAQARPFEVFARKDSGYEVLESRHSPVGRLRCHLGRLDILQPDAAGGVYLGLSVGAAQKLPGEESASSEWKIDDLQLELGGRVQEP